MNKREFLEELRETLSFELPESMVRSNVAYYSNYIESEAKKGRSHADIFAELGDPSLIARSIIDAAKSGADGIPYTEDDADYAAEIFGGETVDANGRESGRTGSAQTGSGSFYGGDLSGAGQNSTGNGSETFDENGRAAGRDDGRDSYTAGQQHRDSWSPLHVHMYHSGCFGCLTVFLVFMVITWIVGGVLSFLSPILVPICLVVLIIWLLKSISGRN